MLIAPQDAQGEVDTELLDRYPFIQFQADTYAGQQIITLLQDRGIKMEPLMKLDSLDSLDSIAKMVASGLGISIVPQGTVEQPFPNGVKVLPFGIRPVKRVVGIVERVTSPRQDYIQVLTAALINQSK